MNIKGRRTAGFSSGSRPSDKIIFKGKKDTKLGPD